MKMGYDWNNQKLLKKWRFLYSIENIYEWSSLSRSCTSDNYFIILCLLNYAYQCYSLVLRYVLVDKIRYNIIYYSNFDAYIDSLFIFLQEFWNIYSYTFNMDFFLKENSSLLSTFMKKRQNLDFVYDNSNLLQSNFLNTILFPSYQQYADALTPEALHQIQTMKDLAEKQKQLVEENKDDEEEPDPFTISADGTLIPTVLAQKAIQTQLAKNVKVKEGSSPLTFSIVGNRNLPFGLNPFEVQIITESAVEEVSDVDIMGSIDALYYKNIFDASLLLLNNWLLLPPKLMISPPLVNSIHNLWLIFLFEPEKFNQMFGVDSNRDDWQTDLNLSNWWYLVICYLQDNQIPQFCSFSDLFLTKIEFLDNCFDDLK